MSWTCFLSWALPTYPVPLGSCRSVFFLLLGLQLLCLSCRLIFFLLLLPCPSKPRVLSSVCSPPPTLLSFSISSSLTTTSQVFFLKIYETLQIQHCVRHCWCNDKQYFFPKTTFWQKDKWQHNIVRSLGPKIGVAGPKCGQFFSKNFILSEKCQNLTTTSLQTDSSKYPSVRMG